jgi:predicted NBD/HSP70 family sugar kinase
MSTSTAIGFDMGATSTKTGVVKDGKIILRGEVIETRQDGDTAALIDAFIREIRRLKTIHPEAEAVGFGVPGIINPVEGVVVNLGRVSEIALLSKKRSKKRADRKALFSGHVKSLVCN